MPLCQPLVIFLKASAQDGRIGPAHISVFVALLHHWHQGGGRNPVVINRDRVMTAARIRARGTYHRCMRELHAYGYIRYYPSWHPSAGSTIYLPAG